VKLFSRRIAELETRNRILTDAAQKRTQRIEELERELQQYERLKSERALLSDRIAQLEAERAFYSKRAVELEEHNRQLTEAATTYALRAQELERDLAKTAADK
jgi:chromosome segregation ATPase